MARPKLMLWIYIFWSCSHKFYPLVTAILNIPKNTMPNIINIPNCKPQVSRFPGSTQSHRIKDVVSDYNYLIMNGMNQIGFASLSLICDGKLMLNI